MSIVKELKKGFLLTIVMMLLCGLVYPLVVTGISQVALKEKANGSLITVDGKTVGSAIVGQAFTNPMYMKSRPSAVNYNTYTEEAKNDGSYGGVSSGSNNYAPSNPALLERVEADMNAFLAANPTIKKEDIPTDLLTASGSGLDPHISPASAEVQIPAIAKVSGLSEETLREIVESCTTGKWLGIFGEETVNVLKVNLEIAKQVGVIQE